MGFFKKLFGDKASRDNKALEPILQKTLKAYDEIVKLDIDSLRHKTVEFKEYIKNKTAAEVAEIAELKAKADADFDMSADEKEKIYNRIDKLKKQELDHIEEALKEILPEAFSVVKAAAKYFCEHKIVEVTATELDRELAAKREHITIEGDKAYYKNSWMAGGNMVTWDMVHYDCQIKGGIVLNNTLKNLGKEQKGCIAEMATGEGKTLVATLPVYLNALAEKGVHVVTVNDYLAKRDSEWMGAMYEFLGLTVDCIDKHEPNSVARRKAYLADITYGTNNEFGFDYLRDNMTSDPEQLVQREHHYALVDEVDSVLIDDARTPLIISGPTPNGDQQEFEQLKPDVVKLFEAQKRLVTKMLAESKKTLSASDVAPGDKENESPAAKHLLRAYRGLPKNSALIKFLGEEGIKILLQDTENHFMQQQNQFMHLIDNYTTVFDDKVNEEIKRFNEKVKAFNASYDSVISSDEEHQQKENESLRKEAANLRKDVLSLINLSQEQLSSTITVPYADDVKFAKAMDNIVMGYKDFEFLNRIAESAPARTHMPFVDYCSNVADAISNKAKDAKDLDDKACLSSMKEKLQKVSVTLADDFRLSEIEDVNFGRFGLYFVIDEKLNSVDLTERGVDTLCSAYSDPKFFTLPNVGEKIAELELSNLSKDEKVLKKADYMRDFAEKSERLHTVQQLLKAYTLFEKDVDYVIMDEKVKIVDEQTGRIMEGRRWSDGLHQAVEAKENVKVEAATQTYATITLQNYFRMYHKLAGMTGTAETEAGEFWDIYKLDVVVIPTNRPIARIDQEDMIYKTKREKYNAVIEEIQRLVNEGRPVLVGTTSVEISDLLHRMLTRKGIPHNVLNAKLHAQEAQVVKEAGQAGVVTIATNMAGRGTDIKLGPGVKEAGGLAIIGTERHDSRRVDRQLRGRSGRQGDPGSSQFYVSLEDDLMRMFGSDRIAGIMDRMGLQEGEVIQHPMITKQIEKAQQKVEENHFGVRKHLLEYDDVLNKQREYIYEKRLHALKGERLDIDINNMMQNYGEKLAEEFLDTNDYTGLELELLSSMGVEPPFSQEEFERMKIDELAEKLYDVILGCYREKLRVIGEKALPVLKRIYESQQMESIYIPITDGKLRVYALVNLKKAMENGTKELGLGIEKSITLKLIDNAWIEHLRDLDDLKEEVINGASYAQKDPVVTYKRESFPLFKEMMERIDEDVISFLMRADIPQQDPSNIREPRPQSIDRSKIREQRQDLLSQAHSNTQQRTITQPIRVEKKVGRNDPCPCGSGKKYKNCHGRLEDAE